MIFSIVALQILMSKDKKLVEYQTCRMLQSTMKMIPEQFSWGGSVLLYLLFYRLQLDIHNDYGVHTGALLLQYGILISVPKFL